MSETRTAMHGMPRRLMNPVKVGENANPRSGKQTAWRQKHDNRHYFLYLDGLFELPN